MLVVHLFVSYAHVNLCHFFSSSWCQGLASTSACGSSWTFLYTFWKQDSGSSCCDEIIEKSCHQNGAYIERQPITFLLA